MVLIEDELDRYRELVHDHGCVGSHVVEEMKGEIKMEDIARLKSCVSGAYVCFTTSICSKVHSLRSEKLSYNPDRVLKVYNWAAEQMLYFILDFSSITEISKDYLSGKLYLMNERIVACSDRILDMNTDVSTAKEPLEFIHLSYAYITILDNYIGIRDEILFCLNEIDKENQK